MYMKNQSSLQGTFAVCRQKGLSLGNAFLIIHRTGCIIQLKAMMKGNGVALGEMNRKKNVKALLYEKIRN